MGRPTISRSIKRRRLDAVGVANYNDAGHETPAFHVNSPAEIAATPIAADNTDAMIATLISRGFSVTKKVSRRRSK